MRQFEISRSNRFYATLFSSLFALVALLSGPGRDLGGWAWFHDDDEEGQVSFADRLGSAYLDGETVVGFAEPGNRYPDRLPAGSAKPSIEGVLAFVDPDFEGNTAFAETGLEALVRSLGFDVDDAEIRPGISIEHAQRELQRKGAAQPDLHEWESPRLLGPDDAASAGSKFIRFDAEAIQGTFRPTLISAQMSRSSETNSGACESLVSQGSEDRPCRGYEAALRESASLSSSEGGLTVTGSLRPRGEFCFRSSRI